MLELLVLPRSFGDCGCGCCCGNVGDSSSSSFRQALPPRRPRASQDDEWWNAFRGAARPTIVHL
jgi:hypothetical protein